MTLPQPGFTLVTLPPSAGPKATQAAFNPLNFLNNFNPAASGFTPATIIPNPLGLLDIFKPEASTSGVSPTPGAIVTTIPAYTTASLPGVLSPSTKASDLPLVAPSASSAAATAPGGLTTTFSGNSQRFV